MELTANKPPESVSISTDNQIISMDSITVQYSGEDQKSFNEKYGRIPEESVTLKTACHKLAAKSTCSRASAASFLRQHVPVIDLLMTYKFKDYILGDIVAGISLAVLQVPQGMGYALLASLPPIIGLYTSFFPVIVYFIFGRSRHVSIGTMALCSLVLASTIGKVIPKFIADNALDDNRGISKNMTNASDTATDLDDPIVQEKLLIAMSMSFTSGIILVGMSILKLGILASYISDQFMSGFLCGAVIQVMSTQLKHLLGITVGYHSGPLSLFYLLWDICVNLKNTNIATLVTSVIAIVILIVVKKFINERYAKKLKVPVPIDMIVVVVATLLSYYFNLDERFGMKIVNKIPQGLPQPTIPSPKYMGVLLMDAFVLALVNYIMMFIMIKIFCQKHDYPYDANQEMFAAGVSGVIPSFFSSMAGSTSPPRCILSSAAGAQTQLAQLISAVVILFVLLFLAPLLESLPICILACLIVVSTIPLTVYYKTCVEYWRTSKHDLAVWTVTFAACVFIGIDYGIIIGVSFSVLMVIVRTQRPYSTKLVVSTDNRILDYKQYANLTNLTNTIQIFKFEAPLYFATIDLFKNKLCSAMSSGPNIGDDPKDGTCETHGTCEQATRAIVIDCSSISFIDTSGAKTLGELSKKYFETGTKFLLANLNETARRTVHHTEQCVGLCMFPTVYDAIIDARQKIMINGDC